MPIAVALAVVLAFVHFFSESYSAHAEKYHVHLLSFSSGLFLAVIILNLFPEFFKGFAFLGNGIYLLLLGGFVLFHLGEKYIYQHIKNKDELMLDLASIHAVGFFANHFIVGIALFIAFNTGTPLEGLIVFVPLLLHTFSSSLSLNHIDAYFRRRSISGFILPLAPLFGALFAMLVNINNTVYHALFSFVIGALLYIVIRDMLPKGESGRPLLFLTGVLVSLLALTLLPML